MKLPFLQSEKIFHRIPPLTIFEGSRMLAA